MSDRIGLQHHSFDDNEENTLKNTIDDIWNHLKPKEEKKEERAHDCLDTNHHL